MNRAQESGEGSDVYFAHYEVGRRAGVRYVRTVHHDRYPVAVALALALANSYEGSGLSPGAHPAAFLDGVRSSVRGFSVEWALRRGSERPARLASLARAKRSCLAGLGYSEEWIEGELGPRTSEGEGP